MSSPIPIARAHAENPHALPRDLLAWSLCASLVLGLLLALPLLAGRDYLADDLGAFHYPLRAFYAEQIAHGEPFDWMPGLYCGFYLTGEGQLGGYHPWHYALYRLLPLHWAAGVEWLSSYALMLPGMWLWLRRRTGRPEAAMFGAMAFTFGSFNLLHFIHPNAVAVVAHLPWLLWAIDVAMTDSRRWRVAAAQGAIALLTASQLLLGYPQYVWFSLAAETFYLAWLIVCQQPLGREGCEKQPDCSRCVGCAGSGWQRVAIAVGIGVMLGGVQLLPTVDALAGSVRHNADASFAATGSLHPLNLIQLVSPYFFSTRVAGANTHELALYLGAAPLVLAVWALVRWRRLGRLAPLAWGAAASGGLALLMALGHYAPLYAVQTWLPLVGSFRFPCRYIALVQLSAAVLAALGFMLLVDQCRQASQHGGSTSRIAWHDFAPLAFLLAVAVAVALTGIILGGYGLVAGPWAMLHGLVLLAMAVGLFVLAASGRRLALVALVLLTAADLGYYGLSYAIYPPTGTLADLAAADPKPPGPTGERIVCDLGAPALRTGNAMLLAGWQRADGYAGLEPRRPFDFCQLTHLQAAGVRWVMRTPMAASIPGLLSATTYWLEVPSPLPHARLTDADGAVASEGTVRTLDARPGCFEFEVDAPQPAWLLVAEGFHRGWRATADGRPCEAQSLAGFVGVPVGAGRQRIGLEFRPPSLRRGRWLSLFGTGMLAVCLATTLAGGLRRRTIDIHESSTEVVR